MYRLFSRISKGLDPIADCFKEHVEVRQLCVILFVTIVFFCLFVCCV